MKEEHPAPQRHGDLHDPKLPAINGRRAEPHVRPAPVPQPPEL